MNMIAMLIANPSVLILLAPPLLLSLTIHEYAHARVALAFGDPTAFRAGRVSLNPLRHLDPLGTILLLTVGFGWAKPVPVNPFNMHPRRMGEILVSAAGPLSNLTMALLGGVVLRLYMKFGYAHIEPDFAEKLFTMLVLFVSINVLLCVFNFLPLYPLDGHHIVREFLPPAQQQGFMQWQMRFGMFALLGLLIAPRLLGWPSPLHIALDYAEAIVWQVIFLF